MHNAAATMNRNQPAKVTSSGTQPWAHDVFAALQSLGVHQAAYVPDAGHSTLIGLCHDADEMRAVPLSTEEEGIAMLAGAWLGGQPGVLLMQSSGVGNCINMLGLVRECRFPLLMLVTMRGQMGESNPWQVPMGQASAGVLEAMGVLVHAVDDAAELGPTVAAAGMQVFETDGAAAVLIAQRIVGFKSFVTGEQD